MSELSDAVEAVLRATEARLQRSDIEAVARTPETRALDIAAVPGVVNCA